MAPESNNVKAIKDREIPQKIMFGYLKDGVYTEYSDDAYSLQGETAFNFIAPKDGKTEIEELFRCFSD